MGYLRKKKNEIKSAKRTPHTFIHISKKEGKDQELIQSSTTPDTGYQWESNKLTNRSHKQEPRGQPFPSRWPQGNNKQTAQKHNKHTTEIT